MDLSEKLICRAKRLEALIEAAGGKDVCVVAATKGQSIERIYALKSIGIDAFGENKAIEFKIKAQELCQSGFKAHFIGQLQTNKARLVVPFAQLIHSLDRKSLCIEIDRLAKKHNKICDCLIQINTSSIEGRGGVPMQSAAEFAQYVGGFKGIRVRGVMAVMEKNCEENKYLRVKAIYDTIKKSAEWADTLSLGMSADFETAIRCGANMIRIGTFLFGGI